MLGTIDNYGRVFIENTRLDHGHGGEGWEFGTCLWSPARDSAGRDWYSLMREARPGNLVLHMLNDVWDEGVRELRVVGVSVVASQFQTFRDPPPRPEPWEGREEYYRVNLEGYQELDTPIRIPNFLDRHEQAIAEEWRTSPPGYPFSGESLKVTEGHYIRECTPQLFDLFRLAINIALPELPGGEEAGDEREEHREVRRRAAERAYFARNPALVRRARELYGSACAACGDDPEEKYGPIGSQLTECHHRLPLGERGLEIGAVWVTRLEDICLLCPNCHRAIHRRRPAYGLDELRQMLQR